MRIRWKLLILLLTIALTPLAVVSGLSVRSMRSLGRNLAQEVRQSLTDSATNQLSQLIRTYSSAVASEADSIELALRLQAREVENCLRVETPQRRKVWDVADFDNNDAGLGLTIDPRHTVALGDGEVRSIPLSYSHQGFYVAPGVARDSVRTDMWRLAAMTPVYRSLVRAHEDMIHWQYTALENGLHSNFPGHGGMPQGYDPRQRPWYRNAVSADDLVWNRPIVDATTRQVMLTVSIPVRWPNGDIAGVTGIDIRMLDVVDLVELPEDWREGAQVFLVTRTESPGSEQDHLAILAQHDPTGAGERWDVEPAIEWLESPDEEPFLAMLDDLAARRTGVRQMRFQDYNALWAYGAADNRDSHLVVIVPRKLVVAQAVDAERLALARTTRHLQYVGIVLLIALILIAIIALVGSRTVTEPIRSLVDAANHIAEGDLDVRVSIHSGDELEDLGNAFNSMAPKLRDRVRMLDSLSLAMEVQQSLLPGEPPTIEGFDIAGRSVYCDETGGDYYDFFEFSGDEQGLLGLAVGDVSGHGVASALLMTTARALLHANASRPGGLAELMVVLNRQLARDTALGRFMTLTFMLLETDQRTIRYVSAGHDPALLYHPAEDRFDELETEDIPLGISGDWKFREYFMEAIEPGDVLMLATDGVWDTRSESGELFGKDRLREVIRNNAERSADEIIDAVIATLDEFRRDEPSRDDVTLVVIRG
ncbi:MAG: SpoIIE family protein phosphatase [Phycisphaeraceae bacterium]|nr:SpoIIE family protein phosphatase [Phycisphaeraceae bacterium]